MPFNLSGSFLAQFGIDQLHSEGALLVQGKKMPMVASLDPAADVEQTVSNLYVMERVTVPAFSETKFAVRASAVEEGTMSPGNGIVTGSVHFSDRHDLHPFLNVETKSPSKATRPPIERIQFHFVCGRDPVAAVSLAGLCPPHGDRQGIVCISLSPRGKTYLTVTMQPLMAPMAQQPYDVTSYPYVTPKAI
jgi:hypothetical protein